MVIKWYGNNFQSWEKLENTSTHQHRKYMIAFNSKFHTAPFLRLIEIFLIFHWKKIFVLLIFQKKKKKNCFNLYIFFPHIYLCDCAPDLSVCACWFLYFVWEKPGKEEKRTNERKKKNWKKNKTILKNWIYFLCLFCAGMALKCPLREHSHYQMHPNVYSTLIFIVGSEQHKTLPQPWIQISRIRSVVSGFSYTFCVFLDLLGYSRFF